MIKLFKRHTLFSIYSFIFTFMIYGVWVTSGTEYFTYLGAFFSSFVISYILLSLIKFEIPSFNIFDIFEKEKAINFLFIISSSLIIIHLLSLEKVPAFEALKSLNGDEISKIRASISDSHHILYNYISRISVHALIPFTLLILSIKNKKVLFYSLLTLSIFYAFSLMQKSFIITVLLPILVYSISRKKIVLTIINICAILLVIISLTLISNPALRTNNQNHTVEEKSISLNNKKEDDKVNKFSSAYRIYYGLKNRVLITPGKVISEWFENIPSKLPHLGVNGYRFIAKLNKVEHKKYSIMLYPILYPEHHKREIKGNINAASFMYEYANFGTVGLILSGIILSALFVIIETLFQNNFVIKLALNFYPVLVLSSSALTTLLFSGGWGFIIILYYLYFYEKPFLRKTLKKNT